MSENCNNVEGNQTQINQINLSWDSFKRDSALQIPEPTCQSHRTALNGLLWDRKPPSEKTFMALQALNRKNVVNVVSFNKD